MWTAPYSNAVDDDDVGYGEVDGGDVGDVGKFDDVGDGVSVGSKVGNGNISKALFEAVMLMIMLVLMIMVVADCKDVGNHCPLMVLSIIAH